MEVDKEEISLPLNEPNPLIQFTLYLEEFAKLFGYQKFNLEFEKFLSTQYQQTQPICGKELNNEGAWSCKNCQKDSTCIICNDCYIRSKDKHKDHVVNYKPRVHGCCDCGDPDAWEPDGFCSLHKGTFSTNEEIDHFLIESFKSKELINSIQEHLYTMISFVTRILNEISIKNYTSPYIQELFSLLMKFLFTISSKNPALKHITSRVLLKTNPSPTKHKCICINDDNSFTTIDDGNTHLCNCNLFLVLLMFKPNQKTDLNSLVYLFLGNFQIKQYIGLISILLLISEANIKNTFILNNFIVQVMTSEVSLIISQNPSYIEYLLDELYIITKKALETSQNASLHSFAFSVYTTFLYLIKPETASSFSKITSMYTKLIDVIALLHNSNYVIEENEVFRRNGYNNNLFETELYLLFLFSNLVAIKQFKEEDNKENMEILTHINVHISNQNHYILQPKEFSFSITLYRILAIFLTRYAFAISLNTGVDIQESIVSIVSEIPNYKSTFVLIYNNIIRFFGFLISTDLGFWNHYGQTMVNYYFNFSLVNLIYSCDFSLFKIILCLPIDEIKLSFLEILSLSQVKTSHQPIEELIKKEYNFKDLTDYADLKRDINFNAKLLEFYFKLFKNNSCFLELFIHHIHNFRNYKLQDPLIEIFINKEKESIIEIIKQQIVLVIIIKGNLVSFSQIKDSIDKSLRLLIGDNLFKKIIDEVTVSKKGKVYLFSVKEEYLNLYDVSMILFSEYESKAKQYIIDFKSKQLNVLNNAKCTHLQSLLSLNQKWICKLWNEDNIAFILEMLKGVLSNYDSPYISLFVDLLSKYICFACLSINISDKENVIECLKNIIKQIDSIPNSNILNETLQFTKKEIISICKLNDLYTNAQNNENANNQKSNKASKNKALMDKYKQKFKKLNTQISEKYSDVQIEKTTKEETICVICRCAINQKEDVSGYFGFLCRDYLMHNMIKNHSSIIYEQYKGEKMKNTYNDTLSKMKKYSIRLHTCNHYIHYSCYENLLFHNIIEGKNSIISCPLCKFLSNIFIPSFPLINNDEESSTSKKVNISYFENILSIIMNKEILITDLTNNTAIANSIYETLIHNYYYYLYFINSDNSGDELFKKEQLKLLSTIIQTIQQLINFNILQKETFTKILNDQITQLQQYNNISISQMVFYNSIELILCKILFCYLILNQLDTNEFTESLSYCYPYMVITLYIKELFFENKLVYEKDFFDNKLNCDSMEIFFENLYDNSNNSTEEVIKEKHTVIIDVQKQKQLQIYFHKIFTFIHLTKQVLQLISSQTNEEISLNIDDNYSLYNQFKSSFQTVIINNNQEKYTLLLSKIAKCSNYYNSSKPIPFKLLLLTTKLSFQFINLPENIQTFAENYASKTCSACSKKSTAYYICLICGEQVCVFTSCLMKIKNILIQSTYYHAKICSGDNGIVVSSQQCKVYVITKGYISNTGCELYRNKFGEPLLSNKNISNEYSLSRHDLENAKNSFITRTNLTFYHTNKNDLIFDFNSDFENDNEEEEIEGEEEEDFIEDEELGDSEDI